jgi:hypothetical protein
VPTTLGGGGGERALPPIPAAKHLRNILNHGNEPTCVVSNRNVTDFILQTNRISNLVSNWHVPDEPFLSDHRYVCFQIGNMVINQTTFRAPKGTNWESRKIDRKVILETILRSIRIKMDTDGSVD